MTAVSSLPARPANASDIASNGGPSQRIALRRSAVLHLATLLFIMVAATAACVTVASHLGARAAIAAGLALCTILGTATVRWARAAPGALKIGSEGLTVWCRAGILRVQGRIARCSQWSDSLLMLHIEEDGGRVHRLLIAADMLGRDAFRQLAVLARRSAHVF